MIINNLIRKKFILNTKNTFIINRKLSSYNNIDKNNLYNKFIKWTTQTRNHWKNDFKEGVIVCAVFSVTGSATLFFVRPLITDLLGIQGSLYEGPNTYRIASLLLISPAYSLMLFTIGTLAGRHIFFSKMSYNIIKRFIPFKSIQNKILCKYARNNIIL